MVVKNDWNYDDPFPDDVPIRALFEWGPSGDVAGELECICRFTSGFHHLKDDSLITTSSGFPAQPVAWKYVEEVSS